MIAHPAAELFPLMEGSDFDRLVESVRSGFDPLQPIIVDREGQIIDGRNRSRACDVVGITPLTRVYEGDDPFGEAVRLNIIRRHLTPSQIAGVLVKSDRMREAQAEAKERMTLGTAVPRGGKATQIVAVEHGISGETLRRAQVVERDAPDLLPKLISGEMSAKEGERQAAIRTITRPVTNGHVESPMPKGMKASPKRPALETCKRAATQLCNAVELAKALDWDSLPSADRAALAADLSKSRTELTRIIRQLEGAQNA